MNVGSSSVRIAGATKMSSSTSGSGSGSEVKINADSTYRARRATHAISGSS